MHDAIEQFQKHMSGCQLCDAAAYMSQLLAVGAILAAPCPVNTAQLSSSWTVSGLTERCRGLESLES